MSYIYMISRTQPLLCFKSQLKEKTKLPVEACGTYDADKCSTVLYTYKPYTYSYRHTNSYTFVSSVSTNCLTFQNVHLSKKWTIFSCLVTTRSSRPV